MRTQGLRFAVNCSILFTELPLLRRPAAARAAGFGAAFRDNIDGCAGWIGCEYKPPDPADSPTSFGWR